MDGVCASRPGVRRRWAGALLSAVLALGGATLTACGSGPPPDPEVTQAPPTGQPDAREQLAALAAAAQDRRYSAVYTLKASGRADRTVNVTLAADGSWRVDIPGGALGGTADVSVARTGAGLFQCALPSGETPGASTCARIGGTTARLGAGVDPKVQHPFVDVRSVLTDPGAPLSVSTSAPLPGVTGSCYSVETTTASVVAPLDVGIYCYDTDGTLTGARLAYGTLLLAGPPVAAPAAVDLPGPVTPTPPLGMATPPPPSPSATPAGPAPTP
jgi:hypothetical protein